MHVLGIFGHELVDDMVEVFVSAVRDLAPLRAYDVINLSRVGGQRSLLSPWSSINIPFKACIGAGWSPLSFLEIFLCSY